MSDWATFNELFAMPFRKGTYPQFSNDAKLIMEQAMKSSGSAGYAIVPEGFTLEFIQNTSNGSTTAYMTLAEFCDKQLSKLFLQSTMTVEAEGDNTKERCMKEVKRGCIKVMKDTCWESSIPNSGNCWLRTGLTPGKEGSPMYPKVISAWRKGWIWI